MKMVPFYGTVYKSSLYDLIIPFSACESGAEREKRRAVFLRPGKPGKANNLIINSLWIVFYVEWHQLFLRFKGRVAAVVRQMPDEASRWHHPLAKLLQIKENRKLKFILPMLYYIDGV